jgi:hypothetical protein
LPDKRGITPKTTALYTRRRNMIYDCVIYIQTQYVDLYIPKREHTSPSIGLLYKDILRGRKEGNVGSAFHNSIYPEKCDNL